MVDALPTLSSPGLRLAATLGAAGLGLRNILAVTGDPPKLGPYPQATAVEPTVF